MLNPSTADAERDDPTIRKCIALARRWGFGALDVVNLFAWRCPQPERLLQVGPRKAVGRDNDREVHAGIERASRVVLAWGTHRALRSAIRSRAATVRDAILGSREAGDSVASGGTGSAAVRTGERDIGHLGCNDDGSPKHPLYLPNATRFVAIEWRDRSAWPLARRIIAPPDCDRTTAELVSRRARP